MKAWQLLLEWLKPADRHQLTLCAVGLCREVQWIRTVEQARAKGGVPMVLHHYMSYSSPCSFKDPCHYHLGWGVGFGGSPRWFFIITFHILLHVLMILMLMMMMMMMMINVADPRCDSGQTMAWNRIITIIIIIVIYIYYRILLLPTELLLNPWDTTGFTPCVSSSWAHPLESDQRRLT